MEDAVTLLVGTTKGGFLLRSDPKRQDWSLSGPFCSGWPINHAIGDPATGYLWAAGGNDWYGAGVWTSTDDGQTWTLSKLADGEMDTWMRNDPEFARMMGVTPGAPGPFTGRVTALWSLGLTGGNLYAGAKPATLFRSSDSGTTWEPVEALSDHPTAADWQPGAVGLTLHTIVADPADSARMWLAISAAGVFATEDGGASWERRNRLSNAEAACDHPHPAAPKDGETGHCVHNMVHAGGAGDILYQQNHHGVFRSRNGGRSWDDVTEGLPSTFGFPVAAHPHAPGTLWVLPLNGDTQGRYPPDAAAAVWRSTDGGDSWQACRSGLPQQGCYFTVLRQAMATDRHDSAGVYFGTNSGSVFASRDAGDSWQEIARHLPTVLCVESLQRN
ncbi:WD40/YVTN/BNR-like repeat-containing protein [Puniceibacterium confluentis]|uniref:WD40/YVTN/BNR-like repeat-containing protein n=1 Tax=Puniceibacterium confluentis TaxID=1958944 RepID=UPI0011B542FD|nr:sialidase family protein [Puniceibacterium confluentis]